MKTATILKSQNIEVEGIHQRKRWYFPLLALSLMTLHFIFLMLYFEPAISTPDAHSYFAQAKLIAKEGRTFFEPESVLQYIGPHWNLTRDNRYYCTHPPGLPVILSAIYRVFGPKATLWVNPFLASLSLLGLFLLCRLRIGEGWGLLAVALMAVNPVANEHALFGDSHTAVSFFLIWGLFFLVQWIRTHSFWWAFGTGIFWGIIPTIRYPEMLYLPAIAIVAVFHLRCDKASWYSLIAGLIGMVIPLGALCIRNHWAYGAFWKTGYALTNEQTAIGMNYFVSNAFPYLQRLLSEGCGLLFPLGSIGMIVLWTRRWKQGMLLALLTVPITLLYMSWYWKPDSQSMRFLLPTFYVYTIASVWLLSLFAKQHRTVVWVASLLLLSMTFLRELPQSHLRLRHLKHQNAVLAHVTDILEKRVEPGSIIIVNELIAQHLDVIGSWRLIAATTLRSSQSAPPQKFGPSLNISPQRGPKTIKPNFEQYKSLSGKALFDAISHDIWQWAGTRQRVYLLAPEEHIDDFTRQLSQDDKLVAIAKIEPPKGRLNNAPMRPPIAAPKGLGEPQAPPGRARPDSQSPHGSHQIFHFPLNGEPLFLVEWLQGESSVNSF